MTIANFEKIDDEVWCGARPDLDGAQWLVDQGVMTVVDLEWEQGDADLFAAWPSVRLVRLPDLEPLALLSPLEDRHVRHVLAVLYDCGKPAYVHCREGQNRTRVAVGAYQLVIKDMPIDVVLGDLAKHGGLWEAADALYLTDLAGRLGDFK